MFLKVDGNDLNEGELIYHTFIYCIGQQIYNIDSNSSMLESPSLIPKGLASGTSLASHLAMTNSSVASGLHSSNPRDNLCLSKHNSDDMSSTRQQQMPKIIPKGSIGRVIVQRKISRV